MRLRRLEVERFRGIRDLDWKHVGDTACLVGPGDSCKSTILDAVERVLSPRWNLPFDDSDFFELNPTAPVTIRATIVDLPHDLLRDDKLGLYLQFYDAEKGTAIPLNEDEDNGDAVVLELVVGGDHEPQWNVVDSRGEKHRIHAGDRESLGMLRVGGNVDYHLGWNRGSALARVTESGDEVGAVIAEATRQARNGLDVASLGRLQSAATEAEKHGKGLGAAVQEGLVPHLDIGALSFTGGALSLHDGKVPLRRAGLGTRRLMTIAMQYHTAAGPGVTLVDEFEHGLEPHRIRQLLRKLRGQAPETAPIHAGQLLLTTHSPVVLSEMGRDELAIVHRSPDGGVEIGSVSEPIYRAVAKRPAALIARRVVVAEGITEVGLLDALEKFWGEKDSSSYAYWGTTIIDGEGQNAPAIAGALNTLGYSTTLFCDSDAASAKLSRARAAKISSWGSKRSTEEALAHDLSDAAFDKMVHLAQDALAAKKTSERSLRDAIAAAAGKKPLEIGNDLADWKTTVPDLRKIFGSVAKNKDCFKSRELGARLGEIVAEDWGNLKGKNLHEVLEEVRDFAQRG